MQNGKVMFANESEFPTKKSPEKIVEESEFLLKKDLTDQQRFEVMMNLISAYLRIQKPDVQKSTKILFEAKDFAEEKNDPLMMAKIYNAIANRYSYLNFPDKIKPYLDKSKTQIAKLPESHQKNILNAQVFIEYGNLEADKGHFSAAKKFYQQALNDFQKNKNIEKSDIYQYRRIYYNLGVSSTYLKEYDGAEHYLNTAFHIKDVEKLGFKFFIYNALGELYLRENKPEIAIDSLKVALDDPDFNDNRLKEDMYKKLMSAYKILGDHDHYIHYSEELLKLNPDVREDNLKGLNTALNEEQKIFLKTISEQENHNNVLIVLISVIILGSGGFIFYIIQKRKKEKQIYQKIIFDLEKKEKEIEVDAPKEEVVEKEISEAVPSPIELNILSKLEKFEETEKFTNPKITVANLAVMFKTNPTYLSETIKKYKEKNFNTYINDLRINFICKEIYTRPELLNYKISYLAEHCGFSSHSTFTTVFKNVTGISPSSFLREAENKRNKP